MKLVMSRSFLQKLFVSHAAEYKKVYQRVSKNDAGGGLRIALIFEA